MKKINQNKLEKIGSEFESRILIQLNANAQVLYSSSAFISSSDTITQDEWREFQTLNKSFGQVPGIQGIGYAPLLYPREIDSFEQKVGKAGLLGFKLWPAGTRKLFSPVLFLEPSEGKNRKVIGYDAYSEPIRRKAMDLSRDSDKVMLTDKVFLVQETDKRKSVGIVMFAPVFRSDAPRLSVEERNLAIKGWVFCPIRIDNLLKGILKNWESQSVRMKVYDNNLMTPEDLLFDSDSVFQVHRDVPAPDVQLSLPLAFNDKVWTLQFTNYNKTTGIFSTQVFWVLFLGTLISVMLFVLAINLINAKSKNLHIQRLNDELKKADFSKDRFISVLAHDLKTPFNSLLGLTELLSGGITELTKEEIENFARQVHSSAASTYLLLEELLLWARAQSDNFPFAPKVINLYDLCAKLIADHQALAGNKGIALLNELDTNLNVKADELMLKTIFRNLLSNAIKFTHRGGKIEIKARPSKESVIVSVVDNGIGMTSIEVSDLFDISHLHSKPGTANERGTGLGLLICKDMVARHQGKIWVESSPGKGSQFSFTLPES